MARRAAGSDDKPDDIMALKKKLAALEAEKSKKVAKQAVHARASKS